MNLLPRSEKQNKDYKNPDNDPRGPWKVGNLTVGPAVEKQVYEIIGPTGRSFMPPSGYCWRFTKEKFESMRADNRIWFGSDGSNSPVPKLFLTEVQDGVTPMTVWTFDEVGHGQEATRELRDLMGAAVFTSPKPIRYINRLTHIGLNKNDIILDFFSGSATTAHSIIKQNAEDGGKRKFIMVQLPEVTDEKSEARKAGYNTICEIGKERIRRAGRKIKEDAGLQGQDLDIGFRVLKLAESNMEDVYYSPDKFDANNLFTLADNVKQDRTAEDLLFQVMLELGVELSSPIERNSINGVEVFNVKDGFLIATFDKNVNESTITEIAKSEPVYFVMRDASAANDNVLDNFDQLFRHYSPDTIRRIL
jgi:adenine-specific DNA-methyltransferase